jgi:hypothetical protein
VKAYKVFNKRIFEYYDYETGELITKGDYDLERESYLRHLGYTVLVKGEIKN